MKKKNTLKYNAWNDHLANTKERTNYSIRRLDLLIIAICGGGIYIIFETLREFKTGKVEIENSNLLIWCGIILLIAIMSNFFSQLTGYHANDNEEKYINLELRKIEGKEISKEDQYKYDSNVKNYNYWTSILNITSMILMLIGLILLSIFNYLLF